MDMKFKYNLRQIVEIKKLEMEATIVGLMLDDNGERYRIVYWADGKRTEVVVYDFELQSVQVK